MGKTTYSTEYPALLKERVKEKDAKLSKDCYWFLDNLMMLQMKEESYAFEVDYSEDTDEIVIEYITIISRNLH